MLKELTGQAQGYLGNRKPFTAVTDWIDRLCTQRYAEEEYDGIPELVEAINLQSTGPTEASRALRKKLKYSNVHGQKRALIILKALVENCGQRFQNTFANDQLVDRIKIMSQDQLVDASVRRLLMRVLLSWHQQFKDDPTKKMVAGLYHACGGGKKSEAQKKNEAAEAYRKLQEKQRIEAQIRSDRKAAEQLQKEEDKKRGKKGVKRPAFNFEQEKPSILQSLAISQQVATALVNALQHVNREKESVTQNARVQDYLVKTKVERKKIIRYVQLVKDEEFLGSLISANDQIILALELYDRLSKPADLDSDDDEEPLAAISGSGQTAQQKTAARLAADDAEIEMVRKRIADARLNAPDSELEKLQTRQRVRIERHNSRVGSMRSFDMSPQASQAGSSQRAAGGGGGGAMNDLIDLDFQEDQGRYHSQTQPGGARRGMTASEAAGSSSAQHGALSDYSDYESEESADEHAHPQAPGRARQLAASSSRPEGGSWSNLNDSDEEEWLRTTQNHRPNIGPGFNWDEEEADDDPFADPFADANNAAASGSGWGIERPQNQPRKEWGVV
ncbi:hypothetical protein PSEUBRA_002901 [Kalmanozyma brasiliensis GHG001]|uniref:Putative membrane trafficking adapter protein n=1 Tax=Kalmanozyma brasiliensis (strain GHG001) TaxID=1365824 RepID=V5EYH2_KALBG|nr:uncharacterized protein PSEUBRA_002901 [Kalmanozyma brasiliensis GHG001]EST07789.1 hypothetical protein PSEUBRA_002901 [Kalmanozyma brasiliensis GHG001]